MVKNKPVYAFEEADSKKRMLLAGKGAGLSEMTRLNLPEPPELIGTGRAISTEKPALITNAVKAVSSSKNSTKLLCGAGIVSGQDVSKARELGSNGILVASGIVKAKNWEKIISEFCKGLKSQ